MLANTKTGLREPNWSLYNKKSGGCPLFRLKKYCVQNEVCFALIVYTTSWGFAERFSWNGDNNRERLSKVIEEALRAGNFVIADARRFYQGHSRRSSGIYFLLRQVLGSHKTSTGRFGSCGISHKAHLRRSQIALRRSHFFDTVARGRATRLPSTTVSKRWTRLKLDRTSRILRKSIQSGYVLIPRKQDKTLLLSIRLMSTTLSAASLNQLKITICCQ